MIKNFVISALALLAIGASLLWLYQSHPARKHGADFKPSQALGSVLAGEVAQWLGGRGKLVVVTWNLRPGELPRTSEQVKAFTEALARHPQVTLLETRTLPALGSPLSVLASGLPVNDLQQIIRDHPEVDAIVSFVGSPPVTREQAAGLQLERAKLIVVDVPSIEKVQRRGATVAELIEAGLVHLAVTARGNAATDSPRKHRNFDPHFEILPAGEAGLTRIGTEKR